jgi:ubiquinone/menaquinone biosynthesis C-methylase UbiE
MTSRWETAQSAEVDHGTHDTVDRGENVKIKLQYFNLTPEDLSGQRVLAIGGGTGMIHALESVDRAVSIDPITLSKRDVLENSTADLVTGVGERLPFRSDQFDYVICYNVLDHTINPESVIDEIRRVLEPGGVLLLASNVYDLPRAVLSRLSTIDRPHPHHFSLKSLQKLIRSAGMRVDVAENDRKNLWDIDSRNITIKKAVACTVLRWRKVFLRCEVE